MLACERCGRENPDDARFCGGCAAPLASAPAPVREERKVVTVLFADLVGSTARAESLDPEDVRAILAPYHARLRHDLERHGGTAARWRSSSGCSAPRSRTRTTRSERCTRRRRSEHCHGRPGR